MEIRRRANEGRPDKGMSAIAIHEIGFRAGESTAGDDWRAIGESKSSSRRVTTRNGAGACRSRSQTHDFFYFDGPVIQLQRSEGQK
jgi:hypothetical protein